MNRKFVLGVFFVLAIFTSATLINFVSAEKAGNNSLSNGDGDFQSRVSTTLVISQVYGGGGSNTGTPTYKNDYVELKNISSTAQSLNGLSVQYGAATGLFGGTNGTNLVVLPDVTLQPGQYYLIQTGGAGTAGADFPVTPDLTTTQLSMSAASGKVALANITTGLNCGSDAALCTYPDSRIIDEVSYGAANNAEGNAPANGGTALTNTQGVVRNGNGCTDTDNNNNDFTLANNPVPRNQATAAAPCGGGGTPTPTPTITPTPRDANVDFSGDNKSDYVVTRNVSGGKVWYISTNGTGAFSGMQFGLSTDIEVPEDYDGDNKDDIAVYRAGAPSVFYIMQSQTNTFRAATFGQTGDDPRVVADYDGDNKADVAVYRKNAAAPNFFYYLSSINGALAGAQWGGGSAARPYVGDFDGDNKADYCVNVDNGSGGGTFVISKSSGGTDFVTFGLTSDALAPGDYDGDGRTDFTVVRSQSGQLVWYTLTRANVFSGVNFGIVGDSLTPGDYDGDGKVDISIWRSSSTPGATAFYSRNSSNGGLQAFAFGVPNDYPAANWLVK